MPDLAAIQEDRELFEEAAATPGARWGLCPQHPDSPSMPYNPKRCWAGCWLPSDEVVRTCPATMLADLVTEHPALLGRVLELREADLHV